MDSKEYGKLVRGITRNVNTFIGSKISKYGIKEGQFEYFLYISNFPGVNQLELARLKNVGKGSVTKALKILENDGLVRRDVDAEDKRNFRCYISEKGEKIVKNLVDIRFRSEALLFEGLIDEEKAVLYKCLNIMYQNSFELIKTLK